ncbi:MAG TPA: hypothetical protein VFL82_02135 [Thermomicrobiales bacterium]|nr:hypothetical protein [Thermomicrobiales bacterium]
MANEGEQDIQLSDVALNLEPGNDVVPLQPVVHGLKVRLTQDAVRKIAEQAVLMAGTKAPVQVELTKCELVDGGVSLTAHAGKGFMGADVSARVAVEAGGGNEVRISLAGIEAPRWLPLNSLLDKVIARVVRLPGIRPDGTGQGVLINPAEILVQQGIPARFAPGSWAVAITPAAVDLGYQALGG